MTRMKVAALMLPASQMNSSVRVMGCASRSSGLVMKSRIARMAQMNSIALGEHAQASRSHAPVVNVSQMNTGVTTSETAQMAPMRGAASIQHVKNLLVPVEPAITLLRNVMGKLIAETLLMKPTALSTAHIMSFSVTMRCASPVTTSATMTLTVMTAVMSLLATIRLAEATSSHAPMATALIKIGFVMERMTVKIKEMKTDVKAILIILMNVTQMNGLVQSLENASQL